MEGKGLLVVHIFMSLALTSPTRGQVLFQNGSIREIDVEYFNTDRLSDEFLNKSGQISEKQIVFMEKGGITLGGQGGDRVSGSIGWENNRGTGWKSHSGAGWGSSIGGGWNNGGRKEAHNPAYGGSGGGHMNNPGSGYFPGKHNGQGKTNTQGNSGGPMVPGTGVLTVICDIGDKCHKFVHCATYPDVYLNSRDRCCYLTKHAKGICCSATYPKEGSVEHIGTHFNPYSIKVVTVYQLTDVALAEAAKIGYAYKSVYKSIEVKILEVGVIVEKGTAAYGHLLFFQTTASTLKLARDNFLVVKATYYLQETYYLTNAEAGIGLQNYNFRDTVLDDTCLLTPKCNQYGIYRTVDGSCNNLDVPNLGRSTAPLLRLLPPDYGDGVWSPRLRRDGSPLPSARLVSRSLVPDLNNPDPRYSHMLMQFGQFIDHDLSHVPIFRLSDMSGIHCCGTKQEYTHPMCFPIRVPHHDPVFRDTSCINFVRSLIAPRSDCSFGHADQLNQLTHWLDGSQIYGSTFEQSESLREFSEGLLRVTRSQIGRPLLPLDLLGEVDCEKPSADNGLHCFVAGDHRVNEQIGLTSHHTIWLREHNRIALELSHISPGLDDEILYQETRRIVVAEYQHIVYNEWLPIVIGREFMEAFGILPLYERYYDGYNPVVEPTIANAFTTAAFRMGHTLVSGWFDMGGSAGSGRSNRLILHDYFNNPHLLREPGVLDSLTKGFLSQPIQRFDPYVTTELRDRLFGNGNKMGMDLIALNIQRGRDHGLPSYNKYRDLCRLGKARDFNDLSPIIPPHKISHLEEIYEHVDDIDLYIGGLHETPHPGALVGPTFLCIIGDQFARLKKSDRFFYDLGGQLNSFTKLQLDEIRSISMARLICDNTDDIREIQPLAFHLPNNGFNPILPCGSPSIRRLDLAHWAR